jgi:predicted GIY-YIG superfamily endonuclease
MSLNGLKQDLEQLATAIAAVQRRLESLSGDLEIKPGSPAPDAHKPNLFLMRRQDVLARLGIHRRVSRASRSHDNGTWVIFDAWQDQWEKNPETERIERYPMRTEKRLQDSIENQERGYTRWQNHVDMVRKGERKALAIMPVRSNPGDENSRTKGWLPQYVSGEIRTDDNGELWFYASDITPVLSGLPDIEKPVGSNTIYLFRFDMLTPMLSRKGVPESFRVSRDMVKVGITGNFKKRFAEYKSTYYCKGCSKPHVELVKKWPVNISREDCMKIEKILKGEFAESREKGEYYKQAVTGKLEKRLDGLTREDTTEGIHREVITNKDGISNTDRFVRTAKRIHPRSAHHNIARWEWIGEAGAKGRTFAEINARNSTYRKCIKRKNYAGDTSSIKGDLEYDLRNGWIRLVR